MILNRKITFVTFLLVCLVYLSCGSSSNKIAKDYIAISKRDTAFLNLSIYGDTFFGKMIVSKPGNVLDSGEIEGKVVGDTLLGSYLYRPYGARHYKRVPYVLLQKKDTLIQGHGLVSIYMGVPTYQMNSISFKNSKFVFFPQASK